MKTKILMVALMLLAMTPAIQAKSSTKTVAHRGYWTVSYTHLTLPTT